MKKDYTITAVTYYKNLKKSSVLEHVFDTMDEALTFYYAKKKDIADYATFADLEFAMELRYIDHLISRWELSVAQYTSGMLQERWL